MSDGNRVMETELSFAKRPFCYGSHHFWVMSYGNWELSYENWQSKQPLGYALLVMKAKAIIPNADDSYSFFSKICSFKKKLDVAVQYHTLLSVLKAKIIYT